MPGFSDILGHEQIKEHFRNTVQIGKVSHTCVLSGKVGMGRKPLANTSTLSLFYEKGTEGPRMQCHICRQVLSGDHSGPIYVIHKKPTSVGMDDIKE